MIAVADGVAEPQERERAWGGLVELVVVVAAALFFALVIQAFAIKPYRIPSPSMVPTLKVGDRVLVNRFSHDLGADPQLGQIIVFNPPSGADDSTCGRAGEGPNYDGRRSGRPCSRPTAKHSSQTFIKRLVAGPGDTISVRHGHVIRNGHAISEPYARTCTDAACELRQITIPPGHWFLMGDNRGDSEDSRYWGPIPTRWIIGRAFLGYWPIGRVGTL